MALDGYELEVDAHLDTDAYLRDLRKMVAETKAMAAKMQKDLKVKADFDGTALGKAGSSYKSVQKDIQGTNDHIQKVATNLTIASRAAEQFANRLGTVALISSSVATATAGIATGIASAAGVRAASTIEQSQISLQTLIGDVPKANALLRDFKKEADVSPFELKDYTVTAAKFAAATDDVNEIKARTLQAAKASAQYGGDLALVGKALADVSNKGKLAGQEVIQFANAGIPIQGLIARFLMLNGTIKKMPLSEAIQQVTKLQEEGQITADVVRGALDAAIDPKVSEKFAKSLKGRLSTLKDAFKNAAASFVGVDISNFADPSIVKAGGFYDTLGKSIAKLSDTFNSANFKASLGDAGAALGKGFAVFAAQLPTIINLMGQFLAVSAKIVGKMFELGGTLLKTFGPQIQQGMKLLADNTDLVAKSLLGLFAGGLILKGAASLIGVLTPFINLIGSFGKFAQLLPGVFSGIGGAFGAVTGAVGNFVSVIGLAGGGISGFGTALGSVGASIAGFIGAITPVGWVILGIGAAITAIVTAIGTTKGAFDSIKNSFMGIFNQVKPGIKLIGSGLKDAFTGVVAILKPFGIALINVFNVVKNSQVFGIVANVIGFIVKILGKAIEYIGKFVGLLGKIPFFGKIIKDSSDEAADNTDKAKKSVDKLANSFGDGQKKAKQFYDNFKSFATAGLPAIDTSSLDSIKTGMQNQVDEVKKRVGNVTLLVKNGYSDLVNYAFSQGGEQGVTLMNTFAEGIRSNNSQVLAEYRELLKKMEEEKLRAQYFTKLDKNSLQKQFLADYFDYVPEAKKMLDKTKEQLSKEIYTPGTKEGNTFAKKFITDNLLKKIGVKADSPEGKDLIKRIIAEQIKIREAAMKGPPAPAPEPPSSYLPPVLPNTNGETGTQTREQFKGNRVGGGGLTLAVQGANLGQSLFDGFNSVFKGVDILGSVKSSFSSGLQSIQSMMSTVTSSLASRVSDFYGSAKNLGSKIWGGLIDGLSGAASGIGDIAGRIWGGIKSFINSKLISPLKGFGADILGKKFQPFGSIPFLESGTRSFGGGLAIVGERGRELVNLPKGSSVTPADKTKRELSKAQSGGDTFISNIYGVSMDQASAEWEARIKAKRRRVVA